MFGGSEPAPGVLLNPSYGTVTLGLPLEAASLLNRLQAISTLPLLNTADFETGVGFRIMGATAFPRMMAFGAAGDERLAFEAGRVTGVESRALGIHVNFAPVVDVNNNPRNPVINTRSFGEDPGGGRPSRVGVRRGMQSAGVMATLKHFPGHGDTDVDSHLGLPIITDPRAELEQAELPPFKAGIAAGADAVMTGHIEMPALDPTPNTPATLSQPIVTGLLRGELGFDGLVYTDSMGMAGVNAMYKPGEAAVLAVEAGNDVVLHSPDDAAAFAAMRDAVASGEIPMARIDQSVERILRAKARRGSIACRTVESRGDQQYRGHAGEPGGRRRGQPAVDHAGEGRGQPGAAAAAARGADPVSLGARLPERLAHCGAEPDVHSGAARALAERDGRGAVGSDDGRRAGSGAGDGAAVRRRRRRRSSCARRRAAAAWIWRRRCSGSCGICARSPKPFVTVLFGNPYVATGMPEVPAMLLTYDFYDRAEASAVRALAGEAPITGRLPIALPGHRAGGRRPGPCGDSGGLDSTGNRCYNHGLSPRP